MEKYLVIEQRLGIVRGCLEEEEDESGEDPYAQYGYYHNSRSGGSGDMRK